MISAQALLARQFPAIEQSYSSKDAILYALSLGYGSDPVDPQELPFVYEKNLRVVPAMAAVLCSPGFWLGEPSLGANTAMIVHAQHAIEFLQPLAPAASLRGTTSVLEVIDRGVGKGAMVITERLLTDLATEQGWTPESIANRAMPALKPSFYKLDRSQDVFDWDPV